VCRQASARSPILSSEFPSYDLFPTNPPRPPVPLPRPLCSSFHPSLCVFSVYEIQQTLGISPLAPPRLFLLTPAHASPNRFPFDPLRRFPRHISHLSFFHISVREFSFCAELCFGFFVFLEASPPPLRIVGPGVSDVGCLLCGFFGPLFFYRILGFFFPRSSPIHRPHNLLFPLDLGGKRVDHLPFSPIW